MSETTHVGDPIDRVKKAAAIILDFDGTLAATRGCWRRVYTRIFGKRGMQIPADWTSRVMGMTVTQAMETISRLYAPDTSADALLEEWREGFRDVFSDGMEFTPGGGEFIMQAHRRGARIGIASAMSHEAIDFFFSDKREYKEVVQAIVTCDDVSRSKPAPDVYLECARALGCEMSDSVIFEDSVIGLQGARAANPGHGVVCVLSSQEYAAEKRSLADFCVDDFTPFLEGGEQ